MCFEMNAKKWVVLGKFRLRTASVLLFFYSPSSSLPSSFSPRLPHPPHYLEPRVLCMLRPESYLWVVPLGPHFIAMTFLSAGPWD